MCTRVAQVCEYPDGTKSLKLGDFGLATVVEGPLYTVCGTPTYVAPEIIAESGFVIFQDSLLVHLIEMKIERHLSSCLDNTRLHDLNNFWLLGVSRCYCIFRIQC